MIKANSFLVILSVLLASACSVTDKPQRVDAIAPEAPRSTASAEPLPSQTPLPDRWLTYEPTVVELKGRLVTRTYFGPPNYGEEPKTDSKETLPFLELTEPANVRGKQGKDAGYEEATVENIKEMGLVLEIEHETLIGKLVMVKGTLFHAFTGHHHTDVLMNVQSIKRSD